MWPRLFFLLIFFYCSSTAQALIKGPPPPTLENHTVEALTIVSPLILTAKVSKDLHYGTFEFRPITILQAPPGFVPRPLQATFLRQPGSFPSVGSTVLLFLDDASTGYWRISDCVVIDPPVNGSSSFSPIIHDLSPLPIPDAQNVLATVQRELARSPATMTVETFSTYPFRLQNLPADDRLLPTARQWTLADDPGLRLLAVDIMKSHPEPKDIPLLKSLLQDPFTCDLSSDLSPWSGHEYLVRQAAFQALNARGIPMPAPMLSTPRNDLYQPFSIAALVTLIILPPLTLCAIRVLVHRKRHKPRRAGLRWVLSATTALCLWLSVLTAAFWYRSQDSADNFVWAPTGNYFECTSFRGLLVFIHEDPWPATTPPVHLSVPLSRIMAPADDWDFEYRLAFGSFSWGSLWEYATYRPITWEWFPWINSFHSADRVSEPFSMRTGSPVKATGRGIATSHSTLILLFLTLPILRGVVRLFKTVQTTRRNRRLLRFGPCPTCS